MNQEQVVDRIREKISESGLRNSEISRIVVGPDELFDVEEEFYARLSAFDFSLPPARGDLAYMEIPIQMIPWFAGIMVVPKMDSEK